MRKELIMQVIKNYCDKCKQEVAFDKLQHLKISYYTNYNLKDIELCNSCAERVGIIEKKGGKVEHVETTAERLYDIIAEVVYETQGE